MSRRLTMAVAAALALVVSMPVTATAQGGGGLGGLTEDVLGIDPVPGVPDPEPLPDGGLPGPPLLPDPPPVAPDPGVLPDPELQPGPVVPDSASVGTSAVPNIAVVEVLRTDSNAVAQTKILAAGPTGIVTYEAGVHLGRSVTPLPGQVHQGAAGGRTIFDGSVAISGWTKSGSTWRATVPGGVEDQRPLRDPRFGDVAAQRPEELFRSGIRDRRVETLAEVPAGASPSETVRSGKWWLDYANNRVHVGTDPGGHSFRLSVTPQAINAISYPVTVRNLTARRYATQLRRGPLGGGFGLADWSTKNRGWTWENIVSEDNHGSGFVAALGGTLRGVTALRNGHTGILAVGSERTDPYEDPVDGGSSFRGAGTLGDILIENSVLAHNGQARHDFMWEGGGAKITQVTNPRSATVRNNHIHHNRVIGLWFDVWCETTLTESNLIEHNEYVGMMHEISRGPGIMRDNLVRSNGDGTVRDIHTGQRSTFGARTGAWIAQSRNITLRRNAFRNNQRMHLYLQDRGTDWPPHLGNIRVLGNHFEVANDTFQSWEGALRLGLLVDLTRLQTNVADHNQYWSPTGAWKPWSYGHWQQLLGLTFHKTFPEWQQLGLDVNGVVRTDAYGDPAGFRPYRLVASPEPSRATVADFTGDGKTDLSIYRPSSGGWYVHGVAGPTWFGGVTGDVPVPGDYTGDGTTDLAIYRPRNGRWFVHGTSGSTQWGQWGDMPVPGDYTGDGRTDFAVYRPTNGRWYVHGLAGSISYGTQVGDVPVPGDYTGDGTTDLAIYRPGNGRWFIHGVSGSTGFGGVPGDVPVPGDYTGDGMTDFAIYRPGTGRWYIHGVVGSTRFGTHADDVPVPGDYTGDGTADFAIYRPGIGRWYIHGVAGSTGFGGRTDDRPLPLPHAIYHRYFVTP